MQPYTCIAEIFSANGGQDIPQMPTVPTQHHEHRVNIPFFDCPIHACIARPVNKAEVRSDPEAKKALDLEWDRLVVLNTWDVSNAWNMRSMFHNACAYSDISLWEVSRVTA